MEEKDSLDKDSESSTSAHREEKKKLEVARYAANALDKLNWALENMKVKVNIPESHLTDDTDEYTSYQERLREYLDCDRIVELTLKRIGERFSDVVTGFCEELERSHENSRRLEVKNADLKRELTFQACEKGPVDDEETSRKDLEILRLLQELERSKKQTKQLMRTRYEERDNEVEMLKGQLETMRRILKSVNARDSVQMESAKARLKIVQRQDEETSRKFEEMKAQLMLKNRELEEYRKKIDAQNDQVMVLGQKIAARDQRIIRDSEEMKILRKDLESANLKDDDHAQEEMSILKYELARAKDERQSLKAEYENLNIEKLALKRELEYLRSANGKFKTEANDASSCYRELLRLNGELENEFLDILFEADKSLASPELTGLRSRIKQALKSYVLSKESFNSQLGPVRMSVPRRSQRGYSLVRSIT